jgi:hypothetical protein
VEREGEVEEEGEGEEEGEPHRPPSPTGGVTTVRGSRGGGR